MKKQGDIWQGGVGTGVGRSAARRLLRGSLSARGPRVSPSSPSALLGAAEPPPGSVLTEQERGKDNPAPDEYFYDYPRICFHADAAWHAQVVHGVRVLPGHAIEKLTLNVGTGVLWQLTAIYEEHLPYGEDVKVLDMMTCPPRPSSPACLHAERTCLKTVRQERRMEGEYYLYQSSIQK